MSEIKQETEEIFRMDNLPVYDQLRMVNETKEKQHQKVGLIIYIYIAMVNDFDEF